MKNHRRSFLMALCLCLLICAITGCAAGEESTPTASTAPTQAEPEQIVTYTVTVQNEAGTALDKVTVEIYSDETKGDIIQSRKTDGEGKITFDRRGPIDGLVAVVKDASAGYSVDDHYELTGEDTVITLKTGAALTEEHLDTKALLSLGDAMPDFTVTATDGTEFTLSEMLSTHSVVVLNFWYMGCTPCKMEFPYLQEAYEQFSDDVAVLALDPMDGTDEQIEAFRQENGYTFLMAKCDMRWGDMMNVPSYPLTVVIDRYGNIVMSHNGAVDDAQMFLDMFGFFSAEDYEQTFIRSHSQLPTYEQ